MHSGLVCNKRNSSWYSPSRLVQSAKNRTINLTDWTHTMNYFYIMQTFETLFLLKFTASHFDAPMKIRFSIAKH